MATEKAMRRHDHLLEPNAGAGLGVTPGDPGWGLHPPDGDHGGGH